MRNHQANKWINRVGFRQLLVATFSIGILLLALISTFVTSSLSTRSVNERLGQEGLNLAKTFADRSRVALLYQSELEAKLVAEAMLAFPDIVGVRVVDEQGRMLFEAGDAIELDERFQVPMQEPRVVLETEDAWYFDAPVYTGGQEDESALFFSAEMEPELIGHVQVRMGKDTLQRMAADIFRYNLIVLSVLAVLLLIILLAITDRLTKPMRNLAGAMRQARQGAKEVRAEITGTKDIIDMEIAFNSMMDALDTRERELRSARDMALEAARVKGEFAANVSHELRTPLNGVLGMLELLADMGLTSRQSEYVEIASASAESLLALIDDILDFSKIDSGKVNIDQQRFVVSDLLEEIVLLLSTQAQRKNIDFAYLIDPQAPAVLEGDSGRIRQVLINLVGNALKFTEAGEVGIEVKLEQIDGQVAQLCFEVWDTGIGMSPQVLDKIFEAFSQADGSTTRKYGGTGLGLAISKQLVNLLGGEISVASEAGKGSRFSFSLALPFLAQKAPEAPESPVTSLRLLLVDDSPLNRKYMSQQLDYLKVSYEEAADGLSALEKLRTAALHKGPFDLVLVDQFMPGMKGSDLAHLIASDASIIKTRVVLMVNRSSGSNEVSEKLNISGFLCKPVQKRELANILTELFAVDGLIQPSRDKTHIIAGKQLSFSGSKILVVEDNRANQQVAVGMLSRLGCKCQVAHNGREALELIVRDHFDLVLMDCHMPEMDGYEATAQIRQMEAKDKGIIIIAMTANVQKGEDEKCLAVGMNDYLAKPLSLDKLRDKLSLWLTPDESPVPADIWTQGLDGLKSDEILDKGIFEELQRQIGEALPTMIKVFLEDLPGYVHSLQDAVSVKNAKAFADIAHSIKGTASSLGALALAKICQTIEQNGRQNQLEGIEELVEQAVLECDRLQKLLARGFEAVAKPKQEVRTKIAGDSMSDIVHAGAGEQRILIVDDDRGMRFAMRKVLEDDGYRVDEVSTGEQALLYCRRFMPDLVLMDAVMPEMDGFKACAEIQAMPGGKLIPVLIITALNDELSIGRAFAAGATDYISKPVNFAVLRKRIARMLQAGRAEKHVRQLAYNDTLTGLPNRTLFTEQLSEIIEESSPELMSAVLFLDLDRFKLVNDTFGHDAGDLLLKVVAERLRGCVRQGDIVSRFGGDEFTIVLKRVKSYAVVKNIASKIHQVLSRPFVFLGKEMHVSTSIGIAMCPNDGNSIGALLKNADIAMYRAKEHGDRFEFYDQKMEADVARRLGIENDLRGAIERNELLVYYQPQEDLKTGQLTGMEALVRWKHPTHGLMGPFDFIPLAEETGQILELGDWVMRTACEQMKSWIEQGYHPCRVAVNLAGRQLGNGDIVQRVAAILRETDLPAELLELEITESTIMENAEAVIVTLENLKEMGVCLAVDDFGTGYSSLNYLKRFPIDMLKIDRTFVSDITADKVDADIVGTIITLAHSLGVRVIAEGVEFEAQKEFLAQQGCDYIQGYLLGKPMPAEEFEKRFLRSKSSAA